MTTDQSEQPDDIARRRSDLAELGLEDVDLATAINAGIGEAARCTANHPKTVPGIYFWAGAVAALG